MKTSVHLPIPAMKTLRQHLIAASCPDRAIRSASFFKTGSGEYAEHDRFMGIQTPVLRTFVKPYAGLSFADITKLLKSKMNEERLLGLLILVKQYQDHKAEHDIQEQIYDFYLKHRAHVNNWNLVDTSAHLIVGGHLLDKNKQMLAQLAVSPILWDRRIAMVSTWWFIRHQEYAWTLKLAKMFLKDSHDLMHKATGWMLREMGKKNEAVLKGFLDQHATKMPRTMLRYAIEKFTARERAKYLA